MIPRYTREEMGRIWSDENRFRIWLDVEIAATEALVELGKVRQVQDENAPTQTQSARPRHAAV